MTDNATIGRPVRILSLSFPMGKPLEEVADLIDRETRTPTDLIALPETWANTPDP